jgi:hypothetical protein
MFIMFRITRCIHVPAATRLVQQGAKPTVLSHSSPHMAATGHPPPQDSPYLHVCSGFDQPIRQELMNSAHTYIDFHVVSIKTVVFGNLTSCRLAHGITSQKSVIIPRVAVRVECWLPWTDTQCLRKIHFYANKVWSVRKDVKVKKKNYKARNIPEMLIKLCKTVEDGLEFVEET